MQHLDEGRIHAWLDGALTADEAARVERHGAECAECAALVAEARGLVAGASRVLSALDEVPAVRPREAVLANARAARRPPPAAHAVGRRPRPLWMAAAATVVLMVGTAVVWREGVRPTSREASELNNLARQTTEAAADAGAGAMSPAPVVGVAAPRETVGANAAPPAARPATAPLRRPPRNQARDATARAGGVTSAEPAADVAAAQKGAIAAPSPEKVVPLAPPAPTAAVAADNRARRVFPPTDSMRLLAVVVTGVGDDTTAAGRRAAARRAATQRAAVAGAASERTIPATGAEVAQRTVRVDTVYQTRTDTLIVPSPEPPRFREPGRASTAPRLFTATGCYEVVEGGPPRSIRLTNTRVWSGAAEHRFEATAPGAIGYWSQPRTGDVHIMIARVLVTARIDASTGELRGKVLGRGKSERFVARRGCR